jgi:hypothetical protein
MNQQLDNIHTALLRKPSQNRQGAGQDGLYLHGQILPRHALLFSHLKWAVPAKHFAKMQPNSDMGIVHELDFPRLGFADGDAQLFHELAAQSLRCGFTRLKFASGKFPVPAVDLACWAGGEEEIALGVNEYAYCDIDGDSWCCGVVHGPWFKV